MRFPQFKSTFARAVAPVAAGILFFGLLGLALWGVAAVIAHNSDQTTQNLAPTVQEMGSADHLATAIKKDGPIVLHDLIGNDSHLVVDHTGDDPHANFAIYLAHPADRTAACNIEVVKHTATFTDCEHRTLTVKDLAQVPKGVGVIFNTGDNTITLDLTPDK